MAQLYFRMGIHEITARFEHFFRSYPDYGPHQAGYCINAGMGTLLGWAAGARFGPAEVDALRGQRRTDRSPFYADDFLEWLTSGWEVGRLRILAIPEGRVVHAGEPLTVIEGPLAVAQVLETPLLSFLNFETLIATKASRLTESARGGSVLEFGMRRAAGLGANAATRAALIGGAAASSNVGMSHVLGETPRGTHAHSMVQVFMAMGEGERAAFEAYAEVYPDDCLLLVDTVDTLESGVPNAIAVFEELRRGGHRPVGIRLDSGDLAHLAVQAARMLDQAGFEDCSIVLSSQLDELTIFQILGQIAEEAPRYGLDADHLIRRLVYGVGSRLATSDGDPYLDGVYKLVAIGGSGEGWRPAIKISDTPAKVVNPGAKRLWRIYDERGRATADLMALEHELPAPPLTLHHPSQSGVERTLGQSRVTGIEPLLEEVPPGAPPDSHELLEEARKRRQADLSRLDPGVRRLVNPHIYHVSLSSELLHLKQDLVSRASI
jgi:nicotinate phosphoribosyltransferase